MKIQKVLLVKAIILMNFLEILFTSCANRKDYITSLDIKPDIKIKEGDSLIKFYQDSVKLNPTLKGYSSIDLIFSGKDGISGLNFSKVSGNGYLRYKNDSITGNSLNPMDGEIVLKYIPIGVGISEYHFRVKDRFQGIDSCIFKILSFKNLPPVGKFSLYPIRIVDPFEYVLDATGSYDTDQNYGGGIISYIFFINGQTIKTSNPVIKFIFPGPGQYSISLQVVDNDNALSNIISQSELIN